MEFTVHHTAYERAQRFIVCGGHFADAVGRMMDEHLARADA